jgi:predicted O-methyltransferase YrrM
MEDQRESRLKTIEDARRRLGQLIQSFERDYGSNSYLNRAPTVSATQLEGAKLLPDRYALLELLPKAGTVIEVGVDKGDFSLRILETAQPQHLTLIDIDLSRLRPENERLLREVPLVHFIEDDSARSLSRIAKSSCDWIYIDAHHGYEYVSRDIQAAFDKIRIGGYLVFNDYTLWSPANMMNYGVSRAVNEFLNANRDWVVDCFALQGGGYHDIALRRWG